MASAGLHHGLNEECAMIAEVLRTSGYRTYHVGKWHVGGVAQKDPRNLPINRGFDHAHGTGGGGNYFKLYPLYDDLKPIQPGPGFLRHRRLRRLGRGRDPPAPARTGWPPFLSPSVLHRAAQMEKTGGRAGAGESRPRPNQRKHQWRRSGTRLDRFQIVDHG